jgi:hypothetical protein
MIDELRRDMETRLERLLADADKLRRAIAALGADERKASGGALRGRARATTAAPPGRSPSRDRARQSPRAGRGGTTSAVLSALATGEAMTASEVAAATGLGRATVSTTLSKLAKAGEVTKAERGYQLGGTSQRGN